EKTPVVPIARSEGSTGVRLCVAALPGRRAYMRRPFFFLGFSRSEPAATVSRDSSVAPAPSASSLGAGAAGTRGLGAVAEAGGRGALTGRAVPPPPPAPAIARPRSPV